MSFKQLEIIFVKALEKTKELLFPFSLKKWIVLVFIAALAGAMGGGASVDVPSKVFDPNSLKKATSQAQHQENSGDAVDEGTDSEASTKGDSSGSGNSGSGNSGSGNSGSGSRSSEPEPLILALIVFFIFLFIILPFWLLFLWISSRFAFIFYNSAVFCNASVKLPWAHYKIQGNSLFKGKFVISLIVGVIAGVLGGLTYATTMGGDYTSLFFLIPLILIFILLVAVVFHYIDQFVVPIMAIEGKRFTESSVIFKDLFVNNKKLFIVYAFVAMGLGIACGVVVGVVAMGILLLFLILGLIIFGGAYAVFGSGGIFVLICVIFGLPFVLALLLSIYLTLVPIVYFYRNFTLYYLMESSCDYDFYGDRGIKTKEGKAMTSSPASSSHASLPPSP